MVVGASSLNNQIHSPKDCHTGRFLEAIYQPPFPGPTLRRKTLMLTEENWLSQVRTDHQECEWDSLSFSFPYFRSAHYIPVLGRNVSPEQNCAVGNFVFQALPLKPLLTVPPPPCCGPFTCFPAPQLTEPSWWPRPILEPHPALSEKGSCFSSRPFLFYQNYTAPCSIPSITGVLSKEK